MPGGESLWIQYFDPDKILQDMEITSEIHSIADLGCGFGTFTIPASRLIDGKIHAFDIDEDMITTLRKKCDSLEIDNAELYLSDFVGKSTGLPDESMDYVMLFNILHHDNPVTILKEVHRILRKGGKAGIIHWRSDIPTPRGPSLDIRPTPHKCKEWAAENSFSIHKETILEPYHFGVIITKNS